MRLSVYVNADTDTNDPVRIHALSDHDDPDNELDAITFKGGEVDVTVYLDEQSIDELAAAVNVLRGFPG